MIKQLESKKFTLPICYFLTDRKDIKELHIGIPYFVGNEKDEKYLIRLLEYQVLYTRAIKSGLPFDWEKILRDNGYSPIYAYDGHPIYFDYDVSEEGWEENDRELVDLKTLVNENDEFKEFLNDCTAIIDMQKIRDLNLFPIMLEKLEDAVLTNIHNFVLYNPNMYNKKLDGMYGSVELVSPDRNAIICDISGSMTKGISVATLLLSKSHAEQFYADLIVTGTITVVYPYEILYTLDVDIIYAEVGRNNEGDIFKKLLSEHKKYRTVIVFGDNDHPGGYATKKISDEDGKKFCKWQIEKVISFHKNSNTELAGYARWFNCTNIEYVSDWCKYLNKY